MKKNKEYKAENIPVEQENFDSKPTLSVVSFRPHFGYW